MNSTTVSVVIPTRNRWSLLSRAGLRAALTQEGIDLEVIVVDDGSSDETPRRLAEIADPRLRVIRHETSRGVAQARNVGIEAARGIWVAFLDDDDIWSPHKLLRQLQAAKEANAALAYASAVAINDRRQVMGVFPAPEPLHIDRELLRRNVMPAGSSNVMASTELLRKAGGFDEHVTG